MPLKRGTEESKIDYLLDCVIFFMVDSIDGKRVVCRATHDALSDRGAADNPKLGWLDAWTKHRSDIEALASSNYDNGKPLDDGMVIVDTGELTPSSGRQTRWTPPLPAT
jgi:Protein of unknown function (DUF1488)